MLSAKKITVVLRLSMRAEWDLKNWSREDPVKQNLFICVENWRQDVPGVYQIVLVT